MSVSYLPQYQPISTYEYAPQPFEHFQQSVANRLSEWLYIPAQLGWQPLSYFIVLDNKIIGIVSLVSSIRAHTPHFVVHREDVLMFEILFSNFVRSSLSNASVTASLINAQYYVQQVFYPSAPTPGYAFFKFHKPNYTWDFTIQVLIANTNDDRLLRPAADYVSLQDPHSPLQVPQNILNITQSAPKRRQPIRVEPFSTPPSTHSAHGAGSQPSQQTVPARAPPQPPVPVNRIVDPMVETQVSAFKQLCLSDSRNQLSDPKHEPAAYDTTKQDLTAFALSAQKNHELAPVVQIIPHVSNTMLNDTVTQSGMFIQTATILQSLTDLLKTTY
ncbi:hypothetical protein BLNAU_1696 [Blattamonas nauphoetae]|uniref:Uncharacterized protein n=1 Tax=Blattamonas nauphoetae TaxID=2049346 RepID=A0ABQ9YHC9_9EUKA|nr:hypothetical protein BLNAU_1696 [Blattamonas nauphoetae]